MRSLSEEIQMCCLVYSTGDIEFSLDYKNVSPESKSIKWNYRIKYLDSLTDECQHERMEEKSDTLCEK